MDRDGATLVGMTGMPEAGLARELGVDYASVCVVVNHAAGRGDSAAHVSMEGIANVLESAMDKRSRADPACRAAGVVGATRADGSGTDDSVEGGPR